MKSLFGRLFRSPARQRDAAVEPKTISLSDLSEEAKLEVLSQFRNGVAPDKAVPDGWKSFWRDTLGFEFENAAKILHEAGLLQSASLEQKLVGTFSLKELKAIAEREGFKQAGRKSEIAARIAESPSQSLRAELGRNELWVCSNKVGAQVEAHKVKKKQALLAAQVETLELLRARKLKQACEVACDYKDRQFYPQGMNVDWSKASRGLLADIKRIYSTQPKFHRNRFGAMAKPIREKAAMTELWGRLNFSRFPDAIFSELADRDEALYVRMLQFHASFLRTLSSLKERASRGNAIECQIIACQDQNTTCEACLGDDGKKYPVDQVPELPHEACECAIGCRCALVGSFPDF